MTKTKIKEISYEILDYLSTLPHGTEISTSQAAIAIYGQVFYDGFYVVNGEKIDTNEFFKIDDTVNKYARRKGLKLDNSKYAGLPMGLPFNIPFTVKKKLSKREIVKQLRDPNISEEKKSELMEMLYDGIPIK